MNKDKNPYDGIFEVSPKLTWIDKLLGRFRISCEGYGPYNEAKDDFECHYWQDHHDDPDDDIMVDCDECCLGHGRKDPRTGENMFLLKWLLLYWKNVRRKRREFCTENNKGL